MNRRTFIKTTALAAGAAALPGVAAQAASKDAHLYGMLLHLGSNMWSDQSCPSPMNAPQHYAWPEEYLKRFGHIARKGKRIGGAADFLRFDYSAWVSITDRMQKEGMNFCMIDLGEGLVYPSHPELAVAGSWTPEKMQQELARLRSMGLEPIPKLNFSTTHDTWLGKYARMVSTRKYYQVVADVIRDTAEIFNHPRYFHLGYDEEDYWHQANYRYVAIRQGELWWKDFLFTVKETEKTGSRPWIWSDKIWHHKEEFLKRMPKSVLQSNWYYAGNFTPNPKDAKSYAYVHAYDWLEEAKFDQVPCCSSCGYWHIQTYNNPHLTMKYCREVAKIAPERMKGLLMAPWCKTMEFCMPYFDQSFDLMPPAKALLDTYSIT